jgi:hypothetical protein
LVHERDLVDGFWLRDQSGIESSSFSSFELVLDYDYEDDDEDEIKQKRLQPRNTENEGIRRVPPEIVWRTGLILLFAEKCPETWGRRAQSNRYPDLGLKPHSAFPLPVALEFVAVTVAQPSRIHTGFPDI